MASDSIANLVLRITAQNHTAGALAGVGRGLHGVGAQAAAAGVTLAAGVAVGAVAAVKSASDFQRTMVQTAALTGQSATSIGASNQQMAQGFTGTSQQVLAAVGQTGQSANDLGKALYFIASSGFPRATDAMKIMTVAGKDATITHSDATKAADVLTTALNSYGAGANQAALYNDVLLQTLNLGKAEFPALASSLGTVLPVAAQVGMSFKDVGASIATMTLSGLSARKSSLDLNRLIQSVVKPTKGQQVMASALGIDMSKVDFSKPGAILDFLTMVHAKIAGLPKGEQQAVLAKLFGNQAAIQGAQVLMQHADNLKHNIQEMSKATAAGTVTAKAYGEVSKTLAVQWQTLINRAGALAIQIGGRLSPVAFALIGILGRIVGAVQHLLGPLGHSGTALRHAQAASVGLGTALGLLVPVIVTFVGASRAASLGLTLWAAATRVWAVATKLATGQQIALNLAMRANLIGLVITAIVALVVVIIYAWTHWKGFHDFIVDAWRFLAGTFGPALGVLGGILRGAFSAAWQVVTGYVHAYWYVLRVLWQLFQNNVLPILKQVGGFLAGPYIQMWTDATQKAREMWDLLKAFWGFLSTTFNIKQIAQDIADHLGGAFEAVKNKILSLFDPLKAFLSVLSKVPGLEWVKGAITALIKAKHDVDTHDAHGHAVRDAQQRHSHAVTAGLLSNAIYGSGGPGQSGPVQHKHDHKHDHKHEHKHTGLTPTQQRAVDSALHGGGTRSPVTDIARDFSTALGYYQASKGLDPADVARMADDIAKMANSDPARAAKLQQQLDVAQAHRREAIRHQGALTQAHTQAQTHRADLRAVTADTATLLKTIHNEIKEHRLGAASGHIARYRALVEQLDRLKGLDPARAKADADARARTLTDELKKAQHHTSAPHVAAYKQGGTDLASGASYGGTTVTMGPLRDDLVAHLRQQIRELQAQLAILRKIEHNTAGTHDATHKTAQHVTKPQPRGGAHSFVQRTGTPLPI